jgi:hypothetical protein
MLTIDKMHLLRICVCLLHMALILLKVVPAGLWQGQQQPSMGP